jgi:hypothetical protein
MGQQLGLLRRNSSALRSFDRLSQRRSSLSTSLTGADEDATKTSSGPSIVSWRLAGAGVSFLR